MPPVLDILTLRLTGFLVISVFCLILLILWKKNNDITGIKEGFAYSFLVSIETGISLFPIIRTHEIMVHVGNFITVLAYFSLTIAISKLCNFPIKFKKTIPLIGLFIGMSLLAYLGLIPREVRIWLTVLFIIVALSSAILIIIVKNNDSQNIGRKFLLFWIIFHSLTYISRIWAALSLSGELQTVVNSWTLLLLTISIIFILLGLIILLVFKRRNQLNKLLVKAKHASEIKTAFLSNMSHDLRTPLNAIIGFSEMMDNEVMGKVANKKYAEYIRDINISSKYLLGLVNDILDISAIDAGKRNLVYKPHSLNEVSLECYSILYQSASDKNIEFDMNIPDDLPDINADKQALMQILVNILSNAIKYTLTGGFVHLKIGCIEDNHIITVTDNGIGISEENLKIIKIPFSRGQNDPHQSQQEGKGLGLAIATALIELHNGSIEIESEVGSGTVVTISLPSSQKS